MPSWIWQVSEPSPLPGVSRPDAGVDNPDELDLSHRTASGKEVAVSIRAHWARCQARAERHEEEAELTMEEMRRTLEFFKWKSHWWLVIQNERGISAAPPDPQIQHGLRAYANHQASMYSSLVNMYVNHWRNFLAQHSLGLEWLKLYPSTSPPPAPELVSSEVLDGPLEVDGDEDELDSEVPADPEFEERFADLHDD